MKRAQFCSVPPPLGSRAGPLTCAVPTYQRHPVRLHHQIRGTGERFSVLVDAAGIPLRLPHRYSLRVRRVGASSRLRSALLRLRDLYSGFAVAALPLEHLLASGSLTSRDVEVALHRLEEHEGGSSPWLRHQRIVWWCDFLEWAVVRANWESGNGYDASRQTYEEDTARADRITVDLADLARQPLAGPPRRGFSHRELEVIRDLFTPDRDGRWPASPFARNHRRNYALYLVLRWAGLRLGEALGLRGSDVPPRESDADRLLRRTIERRTLSIAVRRRPDDARNPLLDEPRTKRKGRDVPVPDGVVEQLWQLRESHDDPDGPVFRSERGGPLSKSAALDVFKGIRTPATRLYESRWPEEVHTLAAIIPHRFRHGRAVELLPKYFPDGVDSERGRREFCGFFGWARFACADPYVKLLHLEEAERVRRAISLRFDNEADSE